MIITFRLQKREWRKHKGGRLFEVKKQNIRDTPVIVIPKGYTIDDLMDFDDEGYENGEPAMVEEVEVVFEQ